MIRFLIIVLCCFQASQSWSQKLHIDGPVKFLALGDSYTIGQSVAPADKWPNQLTDALHSRSIPCELSLVATSGWRTDDLIRSLKNNKDDKKYNLVTLLIGVNNYYQGGSPTTYRTEFEQLLITAISLAQGQRQHVLVLSIPDYGYTPFGVNQLATISAGIDGFNAINQLVTSDYGVPYISITDITRQGLTSPDFVATDGLHPSGKQYALWVKRILENSVITREEYNPVDPPDTLVTAAEIPFAKISVYPNPFTDQLVIRDLPISSGESTFRLMDALGRTVISKSFPIGTEKQQIDTETLPAGLYFYRLEAAGGPTITGKVEK